MGVHKIRQTAAFLAMSGLGLLAGCIPVILPATQDFSNFDEFEFAFAGWCLPVDPAEPVLRHASIVRTGDDRYELDMSLLEQGAAGVDDCDPNFAWAGCFVTRDLPRRELTADEVEQMQAIFRTATLETVLWFPTCVTYCAWHWARWDSVRLSDEKSCGAGVYQVLSSAQVSETVAFLESLAREGE